MMPDPEGLQNLEALNKFMLLDFMPFQPSHKRTEGKLKAQDGSIFRISKVGLVRLLGDRARGYSSLPCS
jgi:hypothetical protein